MKDLFILVDSSGHPVIVPAEEGPTPFGFMNAKDANLVALKEGYEVVRYIPKQPKRRKSDV